VEECRLRALPYVRPDTFTVSAGTIARAAQCGDRPHPNPAGQVYGYIDLVGDSIGSNTLRVDTTLTPGYVISGSPAVYRSIRCTSAVPVPRHDELHDRNTIAVTAAVYDSADGQYRPLIAPLRVNLVSSNTATFRSTPPL